MLAAAKLSGTLGGEEWGGGPCCNCNPHTTVQAGKRRGWQLTCADRCIGVRGIIGDIGGIPVPPATSNHSSRPALRYVCMYSIRRKLTAYDVCIVCFLCRGCVLLVLFGYWSYKLVLHSFTAVYQVAPCGR